MNDRGNGRAVGGVADSVSAFALDVVTLLELQAKLTAFDLREGGSRALIPIVLIVTGTLLALGAVPVILMAIGWLLVSVCGWSLWSSLLAAACGGVLLAVTLACIGWWRLRSAAAVATRSRREFNENVQWLKSLLKRKADRGTQ